MNKSHHWRIGTGETLCGQSVTATMRLGTGYKADVSCASCYNHPLAKATRGDMRERHTFRVQAARTVRCVECRRFFLQGEERWHEPYPVCSTCPVPAAI